MIQSIYRRYRTFWNYAIVGGLTMLVSLGLFYLLTHKLLDPKDALQLQAANVISWIIAMAFCYVASRKFVFRSKTPNIVGEAGKFYASRLATLGLEMYFMHLTVQIMQLSANIMKPVAQIVVILVNYVLNVFVVFRKKKEAEKTEVREKEIHNEENSIS